MNRSTHHKTRGGVHGFVVRKPVPKGPQWLTNESTASTLFIKKISTSLNIRLPHRQTLEFGDTTFLARVYLCASSCQRRCIVIRSIAGGVEWWLQLVATCRRLQSQFYMWCVCRGCRAPIPSKHKQLIGALFYSKRSIETRLAVSKVASCP